MRQNCGGCSRGIPGERTTCMYCGWNPEREATQTECIRTGGEFQQGVTIWRLVVLSAILIPIALSQLTSAEPVQPAQWAIAGACFVMGPYVLALQLWRRYQGGIEIEQRGMRFGNGEQLDWNQIESIDLYTGLPTNFSLKAGEFALGQSGVARLIRFLFFGRIGLCVIVGPLMVLSYFLIPAFGLLTPFHSRIVLKKSNGEQKTLHDLDEYWALYLAVNSNLRREPPALLRAA